MVWFGFCSSVRVKCESLKALHKHVDTFMPHVNQRNLFIAENKFRGDAEYLFTSSIHNVFNAVPGFPDNEVLPTLDSQRHWATKVRARPLATRVGAAFLPIYNPKQTQAPVRAVALQPTRPIQTQAPVRAAAPLVQTKAPPSLQSRLGPPVCVDTASVRRLATSVSPAVSPTFVDVPAATVGLAANQVMPLESNTPMDDLYDFFVPDVTMTSVSDQSTTISSAISNYLSLDKPSSSSSSVPPTCIISAYPNVYSTMSTVPTDTARTRPETPMSTTCMSSPDHCLEV
ncbi:Hypothetical predicted protein [Mytilus galloprovincialis]|uniref:Uncharacterized protein n=1 Tax=Mytilus galloprovincialis TaxID=29158 RepID=A0A8B6DX99_MYTGA|nr:Hypothetical predicted protein [Mytilus galloprovincialis]VDI24899.1 Hypothetical predicted protein [Mytilus galloprovincialis]